MDCLKCDKVKFAQVDEDLVYELKIWYDNDYSMYNQRHKSWVKNFARKMKRGVYNHALAIKGIKNNLVNDIIKSEGSYELRDVDMETRTKLASEIVESIESEIDVYKKDYDKVIKDFE